MPRIYVDFEKLKQCENNLKTASSQVDKIKATFCGTVKKLDWDIKYEADISKTADRIAQQLEFYVQALEKYQQFLGDAQSQYSKLDNYDSNKFNLTDTLAKIFSDVGSLGDVTASVDNLKNVFSDAKGGDIAKFFADYFRTGVDAYKFIDKISEQVEDFKLVKADKGVKDALANWGKQIIGLESADWISTATKPSKQFIENLTNVDSPFSFKQWLNDYKPNGGIVIDSTMTESAKKTAEEAIHKAKGTAVLSYLDVATSGVINLVDNIKEYNESDGKMSGARVVGETVVETASDIAIRKAVTFGVGALATMGLTAIGLPVAAVPVIAVLSSNLLVTGTNLIVEKFTEKSISEHISNFVLDRLENAASAIGQGVKSVLNPKPTWDDKIAVN